MQDGQFSIPNINIPNIGDPEPTLRSYQSDVPLGNAVYFSPISYDVNPALYDIDKVALQSGVTNWVNSFIQGINQTQISANQYGLFQNQKRIAEIEGGLSFKGRLKELDSSFLAKEIDEISYLQNKNQLLDELNELYNQNTQISNSILSDEEDIANRPVSKAYQVKQQLLQGMGADAGFLDQLKYSLPSVAGSSAATLGSTIIAGFGSEFVKKAASRVAASSMTGPAAPFVATGITLASLGSLLYYARDLESQAEVGGAIAEDLERLKQDYLSSTGKTEQELTPEEYNELLTKAYQGSERQYWKNMSLAAVDALQSMLLAGNVGRWFETLANTNKITRFGSRIGELYLQAKGEGLEEGLQYGFQKEKTNAVNDPNYQETDSAYFNGLEGFLRTVPNKNFINSLRQDYADVLSSMNYGPIKGNGKYSDDKDFQYSTDAGFLLGLITGGGASIYRTAKDLVNYKQAASELQKVGVENADGNAYKLNTDIYKAFFKPSQGLFGGETSDRVHYLREGIRALGRKKDSNGNPILSSEEVRTSLNDIGEAYRHYNKLSAYVDNIFPPYGGDNTKIFKLAKSKFNDAVFTQAMQKVFNTRKLDSAVAIQGEALNSMDVLYSPYVAATTELEVIKNRIKQINDLQVGEDVRNKKINSLRKREKEVQTIVNREKQILKEAGVPLSNVPPAPPELIQSTSELLTADMFLEDSNEKYNELLKIKTFSQLKDWFGRTITSEINAGLTDSLAAVQQVNQEDYRAILASRKQYDLLTPEEETERQRQNRKILADEGFTKSEIDNMGYEALERTANDILNAYATGGIYINENQQYRALAQVKNKEQFQRLFDNPNTAQFLARNFPGVTRDSDFAPVVKQASDYLKAQRGEIVKQPLPRVSTGTYTSIGRGRSATDFRTYADLIDALGVTGNTVSQRTVLQYIVDSPYSLPQERALAGQLLNVTEADDVINLGNINVAGTFDSENNQVTLDLRYVASDFENNNDAFETVVLHELIHKYTVAPLKADPNSELNGRLTALYNFVSDQARTKNVFDKFYGFKNPFEFITEAMTNPEFQAFLKGISYTIQKRTAWEEFLNLVNQALRALGIVTNQTALDEIIAVTSELVDRANRESFTSIRARIVPQIEQSINTSNTIEQNETAARDLYKELYDLNLSEAEFNILKDILEERLSSINAPKKAKGEFKFGKWTLEPGNFIVPQENNFIYTFVAQNPDKSVIVSYDFTRDGVKKTGTRVLNDPNIVAQVFTDRNSAFNFIKGRPVNKGTETKPKLTDAFSDALNNFINYTQNQQQYGAIDPKLLELGNALIREAINIGKTNFKDISTEIISRVGEEKYRQIFNNLRQVYAALFADYKSRLTDLDGDILNLVTGRTTASSMIDLINQKEETDTNTFTGSTASDQEELARARKNVRDKISGEIYKSTGQQYKLNDEGVWTNEFDTDPVKVRYYKFIDWALNQTKPLSELGYYGLLIQDGMTLPDGTPIPHELSTIKKIESLKAQGKGFTFGQIGIIVDSKGNPVTFNQEGLRDDNGDLITFNVESPKNIESKPAGIVSYVLGIPEETAIIKIQEAAKNVEKIRASAKSGKPVLLSITPKKGVPIFTEELNSLSPLANQNIEIEIATVQKDSTNLGYFERHPNQTGFLGGAYAFIDGQAIKIEPNRINESTADLIVALLDEQVISRIGEEEVKLRSKFLKELVFQRFVTDQAKQEGSFYFSGTDIFLNGAKVSKENRKAVLLENARYNITSYLLNRSWRPYVLKGDKIIRTNPISYNNFIINRSSSKAQISTEGKQVVANSYLTYNILSRIEEWAPKSVEENNVPKKEMVVSAFLSDNYKAKNQDSAKVVPIPVIIRELDLDENPGGLDDFIKSAEEVKLLQLTIDEEGNRTGVIYIDRGDQPNSGSTRQKVVFKKIQPSITSVPTAITGIANRRQEIKNKLAGFKAGRYTPTGRAEERVVGDNIVLEVEDAINAITFLNRKLDKEDKDNVAKILDFFYTGLTPDQIAYLTKKYDSPDLVTIFKNLNKKATSLQEERPSAKQSLIEKLKAQNVKDAESVNRIDQDVKNEMDSLANPKKFYYGSVTPSIPELDVTKSIVVVRSIDRLIYDFIKSYNKSIVETLSQPKILKAAYQFAYAAFKNNLIDLRNQYIDRIEKANEDQIEGLVQELEQVSDKFNKVTNAWNDVVEYHKLHSKTFIIKDESIRFAFDESGNIVEENDDTELEKPKNSFEALSGNEISSIDGANKETKALIRGLGKARLQGENIVPVYNEYGIQELVDFASTWNNLAITLQGTMEFNQMLAKMESMIPAFPEYRELIDVFTSVSELDIDHVSQIAKFRQDFSRSYIGVYELVFNPEEGVYRFLESTKNNIEAIEGQFLDNFVSSPVSKFITKDTFGNNHLTTEINSLPIESVEDRINYLSKLGIIFSPATLKDKEFNTIVSGRTLSAIKNSLTTLLTAGVKVTNPIEQLSQPNQALKLRGEAGNFNRILRLESKYSRNNATASMQNAAGDTVYALSLNNFLTVSNNYLSDFANYPTYQDVIALPHMKHLDFRNNPYVKNSIWLNEMFNLDETSPDFGNRKLINGQPVTLTLINYNGLKVEQDYGSSEGAVTTGLWIGDKLVQDFNALLTTGVKEMMRAGDKASAFSFRINGYSQIEGREDKLPVRLDQFSNGFGGQQALNIFSGYLEDEIIRMQRVEEGVGSDIDYYKSSGKKWNLFRDLLSDDTKAQIEADLANLSSSDVVVKNQKLISRDLRAFFNKQVDSKVNSFENLRFSINDPKWIDSSLRETYPIDQLLRAYVVNAFILNVEQTKVFNGDGAFYKAFHKRNSKDTSTGTTMMTDQWFLDWVNSNPNTNLQSKLLGVNNEVTNVTNTVVFEDNTVASTYIDIYRTQLAELGLPKEKIEDIVSKYEGANEGDAQGWITLDFYRTFKLSQGKWYPQHESIYEKVSRGESLTQDEMFYFMPIKAQYAGPLDYNGVFAPAFHKFSLVPLLPSVVKGTKLEALNEKMIRNNVGYGLFESGSKVATILDENGKKDKFYSDYKDRVPVDAGSVFKTVNPIFNHYLKEQVNIEPDLHDEVIFGTQFRKLLFQNLFNNGQAIGEKWDALYKEYSHVIDQLIKNEKQRLLEELGIEEISEGVYKNVDVTKLIDKFTREARRRDMNMNVTSFLELDESTNDFRYPMDSSVNRQQIQNMIMSIINNRLVRQHTSGDLMVQVSGAGFEKYEKPTDVQLDQYGTNGLRFYHLKDGKTQSMQVKVPLNGDFVNLLYYNHPDGQRIDTLERLNEALRNEEWVNTNRKSIQMIGYRIPTQGLNSIEFMEVAEFLPSEAGNILILPTEIVIKAGSDFDIDKLSIFKPSIRTRYRIDRETGNRVIERAYYTEPNYIDLSTSIEAQKEQVREQYEGVITDLKNRINKLRDDKFIDVGWYSGLKKELRDKLNIKIDSSVQRVIESEHNIRHLQLSISFKKDDIFKFKLENSIEGFNAEAADQLLELEAELTNLNLDLALAYQEREEARRERSSAYSDKRALMDEAERVINNYIENYYSNIYDAQRELNITLTEYFNEQEELRSFKKGLQNRIIEIGREVLEDKVNFVQLITPNDTGLIKPMITDSGGIKQRNGYPLKTDYTGTAIYTEKTQEEKFLAGLVGKKALGIAAVNNTFTQLFEIIGLKINNNFLEFKRDTKTGKVNTIEHTIAMRLSSKVKSETFDLSNVYDEEGILKSEFISQMINAYVDVLNDDFIFYANAGLEVAPVIFYLKNAGVPTNKIFYFINHPVIKYYINNIQATKSFILKATDPSQYDINLAIQKGLPSFKSRLIKDLMGLSGNKMSSVIKIYRSNGDKLEKVFSTRNLFDRISRPLSEISYPERQAVLGYFLDVQREANMLRNFQAANSYDTSTAATPIMSQNFGKLRHEVLRSGFINEEYQDGISNTVIKPFNVTDFVSSTFDSLMPVTLGNNIIRFLLDKLETVSNDNKDRYSRVFTNDIMMYIFSNHVTLNDVEGQPSAYNYIYGGADRNSMFTYTEGVKDGKKVRIDARLAKRVRDVKNSTAMKPLRTQYPILDQLRVETTERTDGFANVTIYRGENTTDTQNSLIEQFKTLANFSDPKYNEVQQNFIKKLFKDLALFGFAQSGLNRSPISYTDIIPNELYTPYIVQGIENFRKDVESRGFNKVMNEYYTLFVKNNPELNNRYPEMPSYRYKNYKTTVADINVVTAPIQDAETKEDTQVDSGSRSPININFTVATTSGYAARTRQNASADATIAFAVNFNTAGEKLTKTSVISQGKKYIPIDANDLVVTEERIEKIVSALNEVNAKTLNIAGNGIYTLVGKYTQAQIDKFTYDLLNGVLSSPNLKTKVDQLVSGGQTGFDEAGAKAGARLGLNTTVHAPKGWVFRNEAGQDIANEAQFKSRFSTVSSKGPDRAGLEKFLKDNPRFFADIPLGLDEDAFYEIVEDPKFKYTRITMENLDKALAVNREYGEVIVDANRNITPEPMQEFLDSQRFDDDNSTLYYGSLDIQPESRILDSRNSDINSEVDQVLNQMIDQSKTCN